MSLKVDSFRHRFEENAPKLPGRLGNSDISFVRFGDTIVYFYMTPEKHAATQKLIEALNAKEIRLVADVYENPRSTEFSAIASILPEEGDAIQNDPTGQKALNEYSNTISVIAEKALNLPKFSGLTRELNLIVSHDAHSYHHDSFSKQYEFLKQSPEFGKASLIHDLTLADWDMAEGSISGTIFQDPVGGDRFLFGLLPHDQFATMTFEPVCYEEDGITPKDPGAGHLPFHTVLSPEDLYGGASSGSSKGQRISSVLRGVIPCRELDQMGLSAKEISLSRPTWHFEGSISHCTYANGIIFRQNVTPHCNELRQITSHHEIENVTILNLGSSRKAKMYQIIKKDGGFNFLSSLVKVDEMDRVFIYNNSVLPKGYKQYPISEDQSDLGAPWIQMYLFPQDHVMEVSGGTFNRLSLTPALEIIYRDEKACATEKRTLREKLQTNLYIVVEPAHV